MQTGTQTDTGEKVPTFMGKKLKRVNDNMFESKTKKTCISVSLWGGTNWDAEYTAGDEIYFNATATRGGPQAAVDALHRKMLSCFKLLGRVLDYDVEK